MNYRSKRNEARLSAYTVAKELGIDLKKYKEIEKRQRSLQGDLLDKFNKTIENASEIRLARLQKMYEVNDWYNSGGLKNSMVEMNYNTISLAEALGVSALTISRMCNPIDNYPISDDLKEFAYDFLHNPLNKNIGEAKTRKSRKRTTISPVKTVEKVEPTIAELEEKVDNVGDKTSVKELLLFVLDKQLKLCEKLIDKL